MSTDTIRDLHWLSYDFANIDVEMERIRDVLQDAANHVRCLKGAAAAVEVLRHSLAALHEEIGPRLGEVLAR